MKNKVYLIFALLPLAYAGCEGYGDHGPSFSGKISFVTLDTAMTPVTGGYFGLALFASSSDIYTGKPLNVIRLIATKSGGKFSSEFSIGPLSASYSYYFTVVWIHEPYNEMDQRPVLGTFGCDTVYNCTSHKQAIGTVNFYAYGDTVRRLFYNTPH